MNINEPNMWELTSISRGWTDKSCIIKLLVVWERTSWWTNVGWSALRLTIYHISPMGLWAGNPQFPCQTVLGFAAQPPWTTRQAHANIEYKASRSTLFAPWASMNISYHIRISHISPQLVLKLFEIKSLSFQKMVWSGFPLSWPLLSPFLPSSWLNFAAYFIHFRDWFRHSSTLQVYWRSDMEHAPLCGFQTGTHEFP